MHLDKVPDRASRVRYPVYIILSRAGRYGMCCLRCIREMRQDCCSRSSYIEAQSSIILFLSRLYSFHANFSNILYNGYAKKANALNQRGWTAARKFIRLLCALSMWLTHYTGKHRIVQGLLDLNSVYNTYKTHTHTMKRRHYFRFFALR